MHNRKSNYQVKIILEKTAINSSVLFRFVFSGCRKEVNFSLLLKSCSSISEVKNELRKNPSSPSKRNEGWKRLIIYALKRKHNFILCVDFKVNWISHQWSLPLHCTGKTFVFHFWKLALLSANNEQNWTNARKNGLKTSETKKAHLKLIESSSWFFDDHKIDIVIK